MSPPVFRFAPSPNGFLHLGHAFSALTVDAWTRRLGGRFLLRIEDLDPLRSRQEYVYAIYRDLAWLGLTWEEPVLRQSEHLQVYQRTGEPCPRCGRPVKRIVVGARSTHFCSWCQRLRAADRKGAAAILRTMTGGRRRAGRRWTELAAEGSLGMTPDEAARAISVARTDRTKRAAATRRAAARASMPAGPAGPASAAPVR